MTKAEKPSESKIPARKDCENCRDRLVEGRTYYAEPTGLEQLEESDSFGGSSFRGFMRCPICHTFYDESPETAHDHWMFDIGFERLTDKQARYRLRNYRSGKGLDWLIELQEKMGK